MRSQTSKVTTRSTAAITSEEQLESSDVLSEELNLLEPHEEDDELLTNEGNVQSNNNYDQGENPDNNNSSSTADVDNKQINKNNMKNIENLYGKKISQLYEESLHISDLDEIEKYDKLIAKYKKLKKELYNDEPVSPKSNPNQTTSINDKQNKLNNNDIPFFQLMDDPPNTKTDNKISYESAETFVSAFETIIRINDLNIDNIWNKYLPKSFLFSKNNNHVRWFQTHINHLDNSTSWKSVKEQLLDRFGDSATNTNKIKNYINLKQEKSETIREYMDRYLQTYNRLTCRKEFVRMIQVAMFVESLLPKTKEEVERSLKTHYKDNNSTHYPENLTKLFKYLDKNIGDIQEALYMSLTKNNKNKYNKDEEDNSNNNINSKRFKPNNYNESNKIISNGHQNNYYTEKRTNENMKNPCGFCKAAEYSNDHLKTCINYLNSATYKRRLMNDKVGNNHHNESKVPIYYMENKEIKEKTDKTTYSETFDQIQEDLKEVFKELETILYYSPNKYLSYLSTTNNFINKKPYHKDTFLSNSNNGSNIPIPCYNIGSYTEKDYEDLSPFSPLITISNEQLISMLDTGSQISLINKAYDFEDKSIFNNIIPVKGTFSFADKNSYAERIGKTNL
jgi:hypothetical protein